MTAIVYSLFAVAFLLQAVALLLTIRSRYTPGPRLTGHTIVVNFGEQTVRGIVLADHSDRITLTEALFVSAGAEHPAGGLVHIPRGQISSVQEPEA